MEDRVFYKPTFTYPAVIDMSQYICWAVTTMHRPVDNITYTGGRNSIWESTGYEKPPAVVNKPIAWYVNAATNVAPLATQIGFDMAGSGLELYGRDIDQGIQTDFAQIAAEGVNELKAYIIYLLEWREAVEDAADFGNQCYEGAYRSEFWFLADTAVPPWKAAERRAAYRKAPPEGHCGITEETAALAQAMYVQMLDSIDSAIASAQNYVDILNGFVEDMIDQVETLLYLERVYEQYLILEAENISFENQIKATQFSQNISQLAVVGSIGFILADQAKLIK